MPRDKRINLFLCQLAGLDSKLQHAQLRGAARNLLRQLPADPEAVERLVSAIQIPQVPISQFLMVNEKTEPVLSSSDLENIFTGASPSTILYLIEV